MASNDLSVLNDPTITYGLTGSETIRRHYQSLIRMNESLKDENESLRKRYSDLVGSHGNYVSKLELAQEECFRQRKIFEECMHERNNAIQDRNGLKQQCTSIIRQWDKALRETNEMKEQLTKVQQQRDEAMKEINQAMAVRIKTTKDMARLTEERNAAVQEYSLVMSERDSVHKEIERLQEEQQSMQKMATQLQDEKKVLLEETDSLKREISSALFDRYRLLKTCNDLRDKYGDYVTGVNDDTSTSPTTLQSRFFGSSSSGVFTSWAAISGKGGNHGPSAASSNSSVSTFGHSNRPLDNIDQANSEIEALRKQVERLQIDLAECQQEVEVCKRRRDWAFSERDKIVLERESIRTLCDRLRRERDRAVSDLAEAITESDEIKRLKNETMKELKELKMKIDAMKVEMSSKSKSQQSSQLGTNNGSRDSAIEADLQEFEIETIDVCLKRDLRSLEWGFTLCDKSLVVDKVIKDSVADGKVKVSDILVKVNQMTVNDHKELEECLYKNEQIVLTVQRKRLTRYVQTITMTVEKGQEHGLVLENGVYVSRIYAGSVAAKEGNLAVGDRVMAINERAIEGLSGFDVHQMLESQTNIVLQILKNSSNVCLKSNSDSSIVNSASKASPESIDSKAYNHRERQRKMDSTLRTTSSTQTDNFLIQTKRSAVPSTYQSLTRANVERSSTIISSNNKCLNSSFNSSTSSNPPPHKVQSPVPPAPTLLDRAYNKIFGDRKKSSKSKQQIQQICDDETKTLAEFDKVLNKYSKNGGKESKYLKFTKNSKKEKNGGTWPKYKGPPVPPLLNYGNVNAVTTFHPMKRKQRKSLGFFGNTFTKSDKSDPMQCSTSRPETEQSSDISIKVERMTPTGYDIFEPNSEASLIDFDPNISPPSHLSTLQSMSNYSNLKHSSIFSHKNQSFNDNKSDGLETSKNFRPLKCTPDSSPDYSVVSTKDTNVLNYYKYRTNAKQFRPHSVHDVLSDVTRPSLSRTTDHSSYDSFQSSSACSPPSSGAPIPPVRGYAYYNPQSTLLHVHPNYYSANEHLMRSIGKTSMRNSINSQHSLISPYISRSGDSLLSGNESHMNSYDASHVRSVSAYPGGIARPYSVRHSIVSTPRYSITPSPSPSQLSGGLFGSPFSSQSMDIMTTGTPLSRPPTGGQRVTKPGDVRNIHIERSSAPSMGIQIDKDTSGGVFVCDVTENSLAAQAGLLVGDQLLEICGLNMRNATYEATANVLRQCGNNVLMLVQYNPHKYRDNDSDDAIETESFDAIGAGSLDAIGTGSFDAIGTGSLGEEDEDIEDTAVIDSTTTTAF